MRVAVVQTHPIQYFSPLWSAFAQSPGTTLKVFYLSTQGATEYHDEGFGKSVRWDLSLLDGYDHEFVPNIPATAHRVGSFWSLRNAAIVRALSNFKPDVCIVLGYEHAAKWLTYAWCRATGTPYIIRGESNNVIPRSGLKSIVKQAILRPLYSQASAVAAIGELNAEYSRSFGTAADRVVIAPYSVDGERFVAARDVSVGEARQRFGLPTDAVLALSSGKLIERKQPIELVRAFADIASAAPALHIVFLGDGPLRAALEAEIASHKLQSRVHILGFVNQTEVPLAYRACDFLVFPSVFDTWGVVVNEAMHTGLPVIATSHVGASADLVRDGETGSVISANDRRALAQALLSFANDTARRKRMGDAALARMRQWDLSATVRGFRAACERAIRDRT